MKRIILIHLFLVFARAQMNGQGSVPLWTNRYDDARDNRARAVAVDAKGRIFVTGESMDAGLNSFYLTLAYSSAGALLWTNRYAGPVSGQHAARAIAVDNIGDVIVTGSSASSMFSPYNYDYATVKYSNAGQPLWTNRYIGINNGGSDVPAAAAVDAGGNIFVTGASVYSASPPGQYYSDFATIAYSATGTQLWAARYAGSDTNFATAIAVDTSGTIFVTGGSGPLASTNVDYATVAYSSTGGQLWARRYNGPANGTDIARAIAVDSSGNVIVTGYSLNTASNYDYVTIKYSNGGTALWTNRYDGIANGDDFAVGLAVDGNDRVIISGYSVGAAPVYDYATVAYSAAGQPLWTNRFRGPSGDYNRATAMVVDASGNVFVTGYSSSFPNHYTTVAYSPDGVAVWTNRYGTGSTFPQAQATALAVVESTNVVVTGYSTKIANTGYATIKYSGIVPVVRLDFQNLNNQMVLSWTNARFVLQSAPAPTGPFTTIAGATSPYTNDLSFAQQFFRLISN